MSTIMTVFLITVSPILSRSTGEESYLAIIKKAPDFELVDQKKSKIKMSGLREDVLLVSFVFTTCNGACPATTHRMAKVHAELNRRGLLKKGRVRLLSITLDPRRDTPAVLRNYMSLYEIGGNHWSFLTGPPKAVDKTIASWGMWVKPSANGQLDHPSRIFLIDSKRRIREVYNLGFMTTAWVVEDIETLLQRSSR